MAECTSGKGHDWEKLSMVGPALALGEGGTEAHWCRNCKSVLVPPRACRERHVPPEPEFPSAGPESTFSLPASGGTGAIAVSYTGKEEWERVRLMACDGAGTATVLLERGAARELGRALEAFGRAPC